MARSFKALADPVRLRLRLFSATAAIAAKPPRRRSPRSADRVPSVVLRVSPPRSPQVRMAAGSLVLAGLVGGRFLSPKLRTVAGVIGGGLAFSAASNTCAMGQVLAKMPWNRSAQEPTAASAIGQLPRPTARPSTR